METKKLNDYVSIYKGQLEKGTIQKAYTGLVKYIMRLKTALSKRQSGKFSFGNIWQGYMDYTYFYFSNTHLKDKKLKFALVLNHQEMRFEIWLLGNTMAVQKKYWNRLRTTKWNKDRIEMPQYSILETPLIENPDFDHLDVLTERIETKMIQVTDEILEYLKTVHDVND